MYMNSMANFDGIRVVVTFKPVKPLDTNLKKEFVNTGKDFLLRMSPAFWEPNYVFDNRGVFKSRPSVITFSTSIYNDNIVFSFHFNANIETIAYLERSGEIKSEYLENGLLGERNFIPANAYANTSSMENFNYHNLKTAVDRICRIVGSMSFFQQFAYKNFDLPYCDMHAKISGLEVAIDSYTDNWNSTLILRDATVKGLNKVYDPGMVYEYRPTETKNAAVGVYDFTEYRDLTKPYKKIILSYAKSPKVWRFEISNQIDRHNRYTFTPLQCKKARVFYIDTIEDYLISVRNKSIDIYNRVFSR